MKQRLDLSDEEINSYMDFDSLRRKQIDFEMKRRKQYTLLKWSIPALLLFTSAIWFFASDENNSESVDHGQPIAVEQNQVIQPSEKLLPANDSVKMERDGKAAPSTGIIKKHEVKPSEGDIVNHEEIVKSTDNSQAESVYVQAEPINGYTSLYEYLNSNLQYPIEGIKDSIQGIQTVSFVINEIGRPEKIQFGESLGAPFENEAKRLIENMPAWKPATLNGKPVSSKLALPITFQIKKIKVKQ